MTNLPHNMELAKLWDNATIKEWIKTNVTEITALTLPQLGLTLTGTSVTWDPGNLADGAGETKSVTVTGAALGDIVLVGPPYDMQDMLYCGYVQAADTVEIRIQNESGGAINLASGSWKVVVINMG